HLAQRLTQNEADAHDLAQDAFLRAFESFEGFTPGTNCRAWLFTITYSVFVNQYRRRRREADVVLLDDQAQPLADSAVDQRSPALPTPARAAAEADVETALAELPDDFRAVIVLVDMEDLSYEEAADAIGCPVRTSRSRLFRARKHLARRLRAHDPAR